jgi:hypothetical protein
LTSYFFSSFFSSAAGADDEEDGAVLEAPLDGDVLGDAGALEAGGVLLLEELEGALLGLSRPQAASVNAAATAISSALFIQVPLTGLGELRQPGIVETLKRNFSQAAVSFAAVTVPRWCSTPPGTTRTRSR